MPGSALIGHTGFVGGTLARVANWDARFNSATIGSIAGQSFDLILCAGVSAVKWLANQQPEADQAGIDRLTHPLGQARARELVLISTIDVYPDPEIPAHEDTAIDPSANHAYGRHRATLERWARDHVAPDRFETVRIIRLPALFGAGLRKNALFDLLHDNMIGAINPAGVFQWYPMARLWNDIAIARAHDLTLVNLFPEPLPMARIIDAFFPGAAVGPAKHPAPTYRLGTRHGRPFGGDDRYIMSADSVMAAMAEFIQAERALLARGTS